MATLEVPQGLERLDDRLLHDLTEFQRQAVTFAQGPLLILAGAGTGKTTVITRRIAWLLSTNRARPDEILALTFTDKAAAEMEERVDLLVPYGYLDMWISTFHAFGDRLLRDHALPAGLAPQFRVLSKAEQLVFLRHHLFELPLKRFRPLQDPTRYVEALATVIARAKDEAVSPEDFLAYAKTLEEQAKANPADEPLHLQATETQELAQSYQAYQRLLHEAQVADFGDQIVLTIHLLMGHPELLEAYRKRFRYILVDEFQDTNFAQFRLLQLLAPPTANITVVCDDDQSIYKWRGAAISNVVKFLGHYHQVHRIVLTDNFRSSQPILDASYRLIRYNDPDRLEVTEGVEKRLVAKCDRLPIEPRLEVFESVSSEADWVATRIHDEVDAGKRRPGAFAILVRSNREADPFLRALNVAGLPWQFSGTTGLFGNEEVKLLLACLKMLSDPEDSLSWYHVASSALYACPMGDLVKCLALAHRTNQSLRRVFERAITEPSEVLQLAEEGRRTIEAVVNDVHRLLELSRSLSPGQLLYRWMTDRGWLKRLAAAEDARELEQLQAIARFFDHLHRFEELVGNRLPDLMQSLDLLQALEEPTAGEIELISTERVNVLTLHKAKGLEFPVVFMVGLVQGKFPTTLRRDPIELPEPLIQDILPSGDYHLQEERRLCYVGMTRAREELYLTAASHYGGRSVRKVSQFALEALNLSSAIPPVFQPSSLERISRAQPPPASPTSRLPFAMALEPLRLDPHGADDYVTCPLKFRYSHVLRLPIMKHHLVIYGAALHKAVEMYFKRLLQGQRMTEDELLQTFEHAWSSEGFLTREHEAMRLAQGRQTLKRFFAAQHQHPERPSQIEEKFSFPLDDFLVVGRWDRVDCQGDAAIIIDYKSSEITDQAQANRRARESLQMAIYALAWRTLHGRLPLRVELRFLETDVIGQTAFTEDDLEATTQRLREIAQGIRALDFHAKPQEFSCRWCAYQAICPSAFNASR